MPGRSIAGDSQIAWNTLLVHAIPSSCTPTHTLCAAQLTKHTLISAQLNLTLSAAFYTTCGTRKVWFPSVCRRSVLLLTLTRIPNAYACLIQMVAVL